MNAIRIYSHADIEKTLVAAFEKRYLQGTTVRLVGLLFARPEVKLAKDEILPSFSYFSHRSGDNVDFFCVGYDRVFDDSPGFIAGPDDINTWHFDAARFAESVARLEIETTWKYRGRTDLLLFNAVFAKESQTVRLDYSSTVVCRLEEMIEIGAITCVQSFFEEVVRFTEHYRGGDPACAVSDVTGLKSTLSSIKRILLSLFPKNIGDALAKAAVFAVADLTRSETVEITEASRMILRFSYSCDRGGHPAADVNTRFLKSLPNLTTKGDGLFEHTRISGRAVVGIGEFADAASKWLDAHAYSDAMITLTDGGRELALKTSDAVRDADHVRNVIIKFVGGEKLPAFDVSAVLRQNRKRR